MLAQMRALISLPDAVGVRLAGLLAATTAAADASFEARMHALIIRRVPLAVGLFFLLTSVGGVLELVYFSERLPAMAIANVGYIAAIAVVMIGVRRQPQHALRYVVVCSAFLSIVMSGYFAAVGGNAETLVMIHVIYLTGLLAIYPWGAIGQLLGGSGTVIGYVLALMWGSVPAVPAVYGLFGMITAYALSVVGCDLLHLHRRESHKHAVEIERANRVLLRANVELRAANEANDRVLANASHDLRTPLNVIIGYSQLALEGTFGMLTPDLRDTLERIITNGRNQLGLVEDLLTLSRLGLDQMVVNLSDVAIAPVLHDLETVATGLIQQRPIEVIVRDVDPRLHVRADPERLHQLLGNLVANAVKFTDRGQLEMWSSGNNGHVRIAVRDTGIGIAPENRDKIFEPLFRADETGVAGAGLGLAIARRLASAMHGSLTVDSTPGEGSTFWLTLPAAAKDRLE
jgi:signal transduction histidine kinase